MGGFITLKLLEKIESLRPGFLDGVDIFAGTSAGAINSSIIATAASPAAGFAAVRKQWSRMWGADPDLVHLMLGITGRFPITPNTPVVDSLRELLGDRKLGDVERKIVIPALRLDNRAAVKTERRWGIRVFSNFIPEAPEANDLLRDVVVRSASAPVVWPSHQGYADGGLFANNPSLLALSHAMDHLDATQDQFRVLSIGTGQKYSYIESSRGQLGYSHWMLDPSQPMALVQAVMDCNSAAANYTCSRLLQDNFFRLDPKLGESLMTRSLTPEVEAKYDAIVAAAEIDGVLDWLDYQQWVKPEAKPATVGV
jgi:patatin-like phospholipase/acyl hydrolase